MLLPDNIHPENSIYYNGGIIIKEVKMKNNLNILELYSKVKKEYSMSFSIFLLSLDWLYLINILEINEMGCVVLCT